MTLFTSGRLQAYERMMQDTGRGYRRDEHAAEPSSKPAEKEKKKPAEKAGEHHGSIQG